MHHFKYRDNVLFCEDVSVRQIADKIGTPFYLYSHATLKRHFQAFDTAFEGIDNLICYSAKANTNLAVLKLFADLGCGLDIVSGGELYRGLKSGFAANRVVYSGVGKSADEIDYALEKGILMFNVESLVELELINERAGRLNKRAPIAIRVNPDVDPKTHPYISTGLKKNKFGIDAEAAIEGYQVAGRLEHVDVVGVACHIGSQITESNPFEEALKSLITLIKALKKMDINIQYLDMGGGLGITYADEKPPPIREYAASIIEQLKDMDLKLVLEPGRVFVGNAGILVTKVLYRKFGGVKNFVIVDAGMNDLMRPTLYNAFHAIEPVVNSGKDLMVADVVGPICESSDFLAVDRSMATVDGGDLLAVMSAGAYGYVMSSNYCSRPRVAEVMVKEGRFHVVKARENFEDLVRGETVPPFLGE
ncbi:Diaminopimelate decarboxylase (EC [Olavius sp. associated proteobacterium Delta 1]|nr:Diaminopimelate decarboxylase (EC [Olavius sp. associated proteobacterium Delta 1]